MKLAIFATLVAGTAAFVGPQKASVSNYIASFSKYLCTGKPNREYFEFSLALILPTLCCIPPFSIHLRLPVLP
jgi:hypothetical protein